MKNTVSLIALAAIFASQSHMQAAQAPEYTQEFRAQNCAQLAKMCTEARAKLDKDRADNEAHQKSLCRSGYNTGYKDFIAHATANRGLGEFISKARGQYYDDIFLACHIKGAQDAAEDLQAEALQKSKAEAKTAQ